MSDWDGHYQRDSQADHGSEWIWGVSLAPTVLSLLTPEYQKRMVQLINHEAVTNPPQWNASFGYPKDSPVGGRSLRRRETSNSR
jgi:hypothetical protein